MHPFNYVIKIAFFGGTNYNKKCDEVQQKFLEHLALEVNYLLMISCLISFSFLSCGRRSPQEEVNPTIVKRTMDMDVLSNRAFITIVFTIFVL